jgi:hypothetical protein
VLGSDKSVGIRFEITLTLTLTLIQTQELVRLWAHEALRLFHDRLIAVEEREWCDDMVDTVG